MAWAQPGSSDECWFRASTWASGVDGWILLLSELITANGFLVASPEHTLPSWAFGSNCFYSETPPLKVNCSHNSHGIKNWLTQTYTVHSRYVIRKLVMSNEKDGHCLLLVLSKQDILHNIKMGVIWFYIKIGGLQIIGQEVALCLET